MMIIIYKQYHELEHIQVALNLYKFCSMLIKDYRYNINDRSGMKDGLDNLLL